MAAAPAPPVVDYGNNTVEFMFRFDPSNMKKGETLREHFTGEQFVDHVGIAVADLFNPTGAQITTNASPAQFGVSAFHGAEGGVPGSKDPDWVRTANRVPIRGAGVDSHHQHATMPGAIHTNDIKLRPTLDQFKDRAKANNRKGISAWSQMDESNVTTGVHISKVGDKKKYIVPMANTDGTRNAMHSYLSRSARDPTFMKGVYHETKAKMETMEDGSKAYVIEDPDHFQAMKKLLTYLAASHSPYRRGIGMSLTKLDNVKATEPVIVSIKFNRHTITKDGGFNAAIEDAAVTEADMRRLVNGGADEPEMVTASGEVLRVPGFGEELSKAKNPEEFAATHSYVPYSEEADAE